MLTVLLVLAACGEQSTGTQVGSDGSGAGDSETTGTPTSSDGGEDASETPTGEPTPTAGPTPTTGSTATDGPGEEEAEMDGDWYLVEADGPGMDGLPPGDRDVTLTVEGGTLAGNAGCNSYSAEYSRDGEAVQVGEVVRTEMACDPPAVMAAEDAYLGALSDVEQAVLEGDQLVLTGAGVTLRFSSLMMPLTPSPEASGGALTDG